MKSSSLIVLACVLSSSLLAAGCGDSAERNKPRKIESAKDMVQTVRSAMEYINDRSDKSNGKVFNNGDVKSMQVKCKKGKGVIEGIVASPIKHTYICIYATKGSDNGNFAYASVRSDGTIKAIEFDDGFDMPVFFISYGTDGKVKLLAEH